ncbi:MAG: RecQ family ATP-dependent DNA helicase [Planctomycetes bacterium]|nr:RecQ family ATP-dependent DNA helicase [Planctomycetota bacterium]
MSAPTDQLAHATSLLRERFGHAAFRPGQEEALRSVLAGRSLLAVMPTGSGKSLLYQLPALLGDGLTVVISPLIALMKDQVDELSRRRIPATFVNSSLSVEEQRNRLARCIRGEYRLLYVAPERMRNTAFCEMLRRVKVARMAVDEAHCISEWGHDFRPDYRRLKDFRQVMGGPRVTALTATATPRVQRDIVESLGLKPDEVDTHVHGFDRPNLTLSVVNANDEDSKDEFLHGFLKEERGAGIIYVGTRKMADGLAAKLKEVEPTARAYHAGQESDERTSAQEAFIGGTARVIVATIAFGMGIDKPDVRFVIHYQYPASVEGYYQEIGRAGRDGLPARCTLLYSPGDRMLREFFIDINYPAREQVEMVYDVLWEIEDNPVLMTYRQIAEECGEGIKEGHVGSAVRLLDGAGMTRALTGEHTALVRIFRPAAEILESLRGPSQRRVLEALSVVADLETPGDYDVDLSQIASAARLSPEQVRRALTSLDEDGHLHYEPPFRGRGVEKLVEPPPPFHKVPIDWKRQEMLRRIEEEKLAAMEDYIHSSKCRRRFIVEYFGEKTGLRCGECDRCAAAQPREQRPGGILGQEPQVARVVLACVSGLRFPLGAHRVAQVVTGSGAKEILEWGLTANPAYGLVRAKADEVKRAIDQLLTEGYLMREGGDYPTLALTPAGEEEAGRLDLSALAARPLRAAPAAAPSDDAAVRRAALQCVAGMGTRIGIGKVAEAITGSRAEWVHRLGADQLAAYASVNIKRADAEAVIRTMVEERLLKLDDRSGYPVLQLTPAGTRAMERLEAAQFEEMGGDGEPEEPCSDLLDDAVMSDPGSEMEEVRLRLDWLLDRVLICPATEAKEIVGHLRLFHPGEVAAELARRYDREKGVRERSRAVWAAGELCREHGLGFLIRCLRSEDPSIRRLAGVALGKAAAGASAASKTLAEQLALAEKALAKQRDAPPEQRAT